jgi:hypothetical protein
MRGVAAIIVRTEGSFRNSIDCTANRPTCYSVSLARASFDAIHAARGNGSVARGLQLQLLNLPVSP